MRCHLPDKKHFLHQPLPGKEDYIAVDYVASGNNAHVFRARNEGLKHDLACKIIPRKNLKDDWRAEIEKANLLTTPVVVRFHSYGEWQISSEGIECVYVCWEYVTGSSLRRYLSKEDVSTTFVTLLLERLLDLLNELSERGLQHGDIHSGNIIVEDRASSLMPPRYGFRVTDFGVASAASEASFKDDFEQVAAVCREVLARVNYQNSTARERFSYNVINNEFIGRHLVERDPNRDPLARNPRRLFDRLREIDSEYMKKAEAEETHLALATPFDYLSCEQFGDSHGLLRALYSNRFLGLPNIESRNNLVLTGPRGCGKTTVFRSLSLKHQVLSRVPRVEDVPYIAIYYRCDDLYFAFPRYVLPEKEPAFDIPIHFMTASLLAELLDSIELWARQCFAEEFGSLESTCVSAIWAALEIKAPAKPESAFLRGVIQELQYQRKRAAEKHRFANDEKQPINFLFGPGILPRVCEVLLQHLPFLNRRPIYFLVDDYSAPKVSKQLQKNLNRLFMQRTAACFFKLSTESPVSYSKEDIDDKTYVEGREFVVVNLGVEFIHAESIAKSAFIEDVFNLRLRAIEGYPAATLDQLVGSNQDQSSHNKTALQIREGKLVQVWGKESFTELCSGDIHALLNLANDMVNKVGGKDALARSSHVPKVSSAIQNKCVRDQAGNFLRNLRGIDAIGAQLVAVVEAFGKVAHSYLKFRESRNEEGEPPHQASRIEPLDAVNLSPSARQIYDELLRYSVFIEDMRGKSRRGAVVPRLYLRRFLIPHFNLTFSRRDSLEIESRELERLLTQPEEFEKRKRLRERRDDPPSGQKALY